MAKQKHSLRVLMVVSGLLAFSEASARDDSKLTDLDQKLGKGWQCFAMPSGLEKVGEVFERKPDGSTFILASLKGNDTQSAPIAVGTITTSNHFSLGAAISMISVFFPSLSADFSQDKSISIKISDAEKQSGMLSIQDAADAWATSNKPLFASKSRFFIVREAILAGGVDYAFDKKVATDIKLSLALNAPKTATAPAKSTTSSSAPTKPATTSESAAPNPPASGASGAADSGSTAPATQASSTVSPPKQVAGDPAYHVSQTFNPKIGICIHPDEIEIANQLTGTVSAELVSVDEDLGLH